MSAEVLREAAKLMRERAAAATPSGRWERDFPYGTGSASQGSLHLRDGSIYVAIAGPGPDADHIASWHPAVGLAVADWLDVVAARYEALVDTFAPGSRAGHVTATENVTGWAEAETVARAYLGADR